MMLGKATQRLLLPVDVRFLWLTLLVAMLLNLLPLGRITWMPDFLMLTLAFWCLNQPRHTGVFIASSFGLLMDVHHGTLLGMHALVYAGMAYLVYLLHRRLQQFGAFGQALQLASVFLLVHACLWFLQMAAGGRWPGMGLLWAPLLETLLWPLWHVVLLAPQRRAPDPDLTRPL